MAHSYRRTALVAMQNFGADEEEGEEEEEEEEGADFAAGAGDVEYCDDDGAVPETGGGGGGGGGGGRGVGGGRPPTQPKRGRPAGSLARSPHITFEQVATTFHMNVRDAAVALGICRTTLKSVCRNLGISRWPKRLLAKAGLADLPAGVRPANAPDSRPVQGWKGPVAVLKPKAAPKAAPKAPPKAPSAPPRPAPPPQAAPPLLQRRGEGGRSLVALIEQGAQQLVEQRALPWAR